MVNQRHGIPFTAFLNDNNCSIDSCQYWQCRKVMKTIFAISLVNGKLFIQHRRLIIVSLTLGIYAQGSSWSYYIKLHNLWTHLHAGRCACFTLTVDTKSGLGLETVTLPLWRLVSLIAAVPLYCLKWFGALTALNTSSYPDL